VTQVWRRENRRIVFLSPSAVHYPPAGTLEVLGVDDDGAIKVAWKRDKEAWHSPPQPLSDTGWAPAGVPIAAVYHPPGGRLEAFVVALPVGTRDPANGVVNLLWKAQGIDDSRWHAPFPLTEPVSCPVTAGSRLAAVHHPPAKTLEVLFVDGDGAIRLLWKRELEAWHSPPDVLSAKEAAPAGASMAVAYHPPDRSLEAFVVALQEGEDPTQGAVHLLWKADGVEGSRWHPPLALTEAGSCPVPVGARLSAAHHPPGGTLEVFFVDSRGAVRVLWKRNTEPWQSPPHPLTPNSFAPPGAPVEAVYYEGHEQLELVVACEDALWLLWKVRTGEWLGPIALTEPGATPRAAEVSAAHHPPGDTLEVLAGDPSFFARVSWKEHNRAWRPCAVPIGPRSGASPTVGAKTTRVMQVTGGPQFSQAGVAGTDLGANAVHRGTHWVFFGDVPRLGSDSGLPHDADVVAFASRMTPESVELTPVLGPDRFFAPFAIRRPDMTFTPQTAQTPTGAFNDGDKAYVFVLVHEGPNGEPVRRPVPGGKVVSYLTASPDPLSGAPYELVFRWAEDKFWQVAPWVVQDPVSAGLPASAGKGVILLGHGFNAEVGDAVHLAWLPLPIGGNARASIRYYNGESDPTNWSSDLAAARHLWQTLPGYTSISLAWFAGPKSWVALYSKALDDPPHHFRARGSIVARVAPDPVALRSVSEITLFDPCRDSAYGLYMHWPDLDQLHNGPPAMPDTPGWAYGAHLLTPLARWDSAARALTLHYLMSTSRPYQVQLMRTRFAIPL
jgi:hypothetical protein